MRNFFIVSSLLFLFSGCQREISSGPPPAISVEIASVIEKEVPIYIEAIGHAEEWTKIAVRPQVSGTLVEAFVSSGARVKKGDPLFRIDPRTYQAAVDEAKATLARHEIEAEFAQSRFKRYISLAQRDYISALEFDELRKTSEGALAQVMVDVAALQAAEIALGYTLITAPIDGKISRLFVDPGNALEVSAGQIITEIRQLQPIKVRFSLPQRDFQRLQERSGGLDLPVEVRLPFGSNQEFFGVIDFIDNTLQKETGTIRLFARIPNEEERLWPGSFVRLRLLLEIDPRALLIPFSAVLVGQKGEFVFVVRSDNTVEKRSVVTGQRYDGRVRIAQGLKKGEVVVTNGQINLRPGSLVTIVEREENSGTI